MPSPKSFRCAAFAVATSMLIGVLVGGTVCIGLLGLWWWVQVPVGNRLIWVYLPAVGTGALIWFYVLWLFFTDELSPEDMWERIKNYIQDE